MTSGLIALSLQVCFRSCYACQMSYIRRLDGPNSRSQVCAWGLITRVPIIVLLETWFLAPIAANACHLCHMISYLRPNMARGSLVSDAEHHSDNHVIILEFLAPIAAIFVI